jgi:hypothetical protein
MSRPGSHGDFSAISNHHEVFGGLEEFGKFFQKRHQMD